MTIQQVIANEKEVMELVLAGKMLEAFIKFYGDNVVMIESDGSQNVGKEACQAYDEAFMASITEFRSTKPLSIVAMPSDDANYEFLVVATWFNDITTSNFTMTGNQTSFAYWKDDMIQKVTFKSPTEIIV